MPMRPPADPLPRGLVWREGTAGSLRADDPIAEWAYVTPLYPDGLPGSELSRAAPNDQQEVMRFWVASNYEPLPPGPWAVWDAPGAGWDQAVWAPQTWSPEAILSDEFGGTVPPEEIAKLSSALAERAPQWSQIADQPPDLATLAQVPITLAKVQNTLDRLEAAVAAFERQSGGMGHNGGPAIVDTNAIASIRQTATDAKAACAEGKAGAGRVSAAVDRLRTFAGDLRGWIGGAITAKVMDLDWSRLTQPAINLFHTILEAVMALKGWLASLIL